MRRRVKCPECGYVWSPEEGGDKGFDRTCPECGESWSRVEEAPHCPLCNSRKLSVVQVAVRLKGVDNEDRPPMIVRCMNCGKMFLGNQVVYRLSRTGPWMIGGGAGSSLYAGGGFAS